MCCRLVPGPTQLPPPPPAGQDQSSFTAGDRNTVTTTSSSSVHDAGPALPRRPDAAASGAHSRSSSLDNQLIDFSDAGQLLMLLSLLASHGVWWSVDKLLRSLGIFWTNIF